MIKETLLVSTFGLLGLVTVACGSQKKDRRKLYRKLYRKQLGAWTGLSVRQE